METSQEKLIRYLDDAWAVEKGLVVALQDMADEVNDPQVKALFEEHRTVTHQQEENLEARLRALGAEPGKMKGIVNQLGAKMGDAMHAFHDEYDKTTQNLIKGYGTENFEVAMYESLEAYAQAIGDQETVLLAQKHKQQEQEAADKIRPLISQTATRVLQNTSA